MATVGMDIIARGLLMLSQATAAMAMDMVTTIPSTARGLLMPRLRLSLAMATTAGYRGYGGYGYGHGYYSYG